MVTVVSSEAVLLAGLGSGSLPEMVAKLVMLPGDEGAVTRMVRVAEAHLARLPMFQVTVLVVLEAAPADGVADWKVTPGGRVSVTLTPVALRGPRLVTVTR